ncbi:MAG: GAF domain-containing protein [Phormidesmis sp. RL_2_1]|nr:GAF domain-containing protein [Phormidesmis sp. RL_2_1]
MSKLTATDLDVARLLFDLKLCGELVREFAGSLATDAIAKCVTDGLIEQFGCTFARIWLVNADRSALRLVASSGLYTRLDGDFAHVPMGAFKVGKIAQHCIPFLSNCLAEEDWVKDRAWAEENRIRGFAGLPLMVKDQAIGVLAVFSHYPMAPEFLEVLQILSMSVTSALASALNHRKFVKRHSITATHHLSEQLAAILGRQRLSLLGTEQILSAPVSELLLQTAQQLMALSCHYARLVYTADTVVLEAMLAVGGKPLLGEAAQARALKDMDVFEEIGAIAQHLGGELQMPTGSDQDVVQIRLQLPQQSSKLVSRLSRPLGSMPVASIPTTMEPTSLVVVVSPLSAREKQVMMLLAQGYRDRDIAEQLYISERTVKFHVKNMLKKLAVRTRIQAVFEATQKGWLD